MDFVGTIIAIIFLFVLAIWLIGFFISNDFTIPSQNVANFKKILVVYPHADDEALTVGGLVGISKEYGNDTTLAILTKGEKGTPNADLKNDLKEIRTIEAKESATILGITKLIQEDFGDGELANKRVELTEYLNRLIQEEKPDLIITYDQSGLYGHPDHITTSEIITELVKTKHLDTKLWYTTQPKRILKLIKLPEHMANDNVFKDKREEPTHKVMIAPFVFNRIEAVYAHKSQRKSYVDGLPIKQLPLWFFHSMPIFEYFHKAN